jgi:uncharacterized protein (TIGR00251 family)
MTGAAAGELPLPYRAVERGIVLEIRARPGRPRTRAGDIVATVDGSELAVEVAAPPEDGKANAALVAWLAKALGVGRGSVTILRGETSRHKSLRVEGDPAELINSVKSLLDNRA